LETRREIENIHFKGRIIYKPITPTKVLKAVNIDDPQGGKAKSQGSVEGTISPFDSVQFNGRVLVAEDHILNQKVDLKGITWIGNLLGIKIGSGI